MSKNIQDLFVERATSRDGFYPNEGSWQHYHEISPSLGLSVVAGSGLYSEPRRYTSRDKYDRVEVAVIRHGRLVRPESVGLPEGLCKMFEQGIDCPVAPYCTWEQVQTLVDALEVKTKRKSKVRTKTKS